MICTPCDHDTTPCNHDNYVRPAVMICTLCNHDKFTLESRHIHRKLRVCPAIIHDWDASRKNPNDCAFFTNIIYVHKPMRRSSTITRLLRAKRYDLFFVDRSSKRHHWKARCVFLDSALETCHLGLYTYRIWCGCIRRDVRTLFSQMAWQNVAHKVLKFEKTWACRNELVVKLCEKGTTSSA